MLNTTLKFFISNTQGEFLQHTREGEVPDPFEWLQELSQLDGQSDFEIHVVPGSENHPFVTELTANHQLYIQGIPWTPEISPSNT